MFVIKFTPSGERDFKKLSSIHQARISNKLISNASLANPLARAKPLINLPPATHRFRIGKYRASFYIAGHTIYVERIELRGQAYRK